MKITLPIFGEITLEENNWDYKLEARKWEYSFEGIPIDLDIHFKEVDEEKIVKVSSALNKLPLIHLIGKNAIQKDFEQGKVINKYLKEWNEDIFLQIFDEVEFQKFIETTNKEKKIEERLLSLIRIVRIGVYTESKNSFVTMDFAFGYDQETGFRDDMIVVTLNPKLKVTDICTEG